MSFSKHRWLHKWLIVVGVLFLALGSAFGYDPAKGAIFLPSVYSPWGLSRAFTVTDLDGPWATLTNPAAQAGSQLYAVQASYTALTDFGAGTQGFGSAGSVAFSSPVPFGVWGASAQVFSAPATMSSMPLGSFGTFNINFSKALLPDLYLGTAVHVSLGSNNSVSAWGLGADLGAIRLLGDIGGLKDARVGLALLNMGKGYVTSSYPPGLLGGASSAYPATFTLGLGARGYLVETYNWNIDAGMDLWTPSFADLNGSFSLGLEYRQVLMLRLGWSAGLKDLQANSGRSIVPTLGLSGRIPLGKTANSATLSAAAAPLYDSLYGISAGANIDFGKEDKNPPVIKVRLPVPFRGVAYISPNGDGRQDSLEIPLSITDERYILGWKLTIEDKSSGKTVRTFGASHDKPEKITNLRTLGDALSYKLKSVEVPGSIIWDGHDDAGRIVPDGPYTISLIAWDDNGNVNLDYQSCMTVVVDNKAPQASARPMDTTMIFSPDGDGSKDTFVFRNTGSVENDWQVVIRDSAGQAVRTQEYKDRSAPRDFTWDGTADDGKRVPDGVYSVSLVTKDEAGNVVESTVAGITVDTSRPRVSIATDDSVMSPNNDGIKDTLHLIPSIESTKGLETWRIYVLNSEKKEVWAVSGTASNLPQQSYVFSGLDSQGKSLPDGMYEAGIDLTYRNGYKPQKLSDNFYVDDTPPSATIRLQDTTRIFSPDGDGRKDSYSFVFSSSEEDTWNLIIRSKGKNEVVVRQFSQKLPMAFEWDGKDDQGKTVPDGDYEVYIFAVDRAGNSFSAVSPTVKVDTRKPALSLTTNRDAFSPNGDGIADDLTFKPVLDLKDAIVAWKFTLLDQQSGSEVWTFGTPNASTGTIDTIPEQFVLVGKNNAGSDLVEGKYKATIWVSWINGYQTEASSNVITLDRTYPQAKVSVNKTIFNPMGREDQQVVLISQTGSAEDLWKAQILDSTGKAVRSWDFSGVPQDIPWDGKNDSGFVVPDGSYIYRLKSTDAAGNAFVSSDIILTIDTQKKAASLGAEFLAFSPNGDGKRDTLMLNASATVPGNVASWELAIVAKQDGTQAGAVQAVKSWRGAAPLQQKFEWNGSSDSGIDVPDGEYVARLMVKYPNGDEASASLGPIIVDRIVPKATVVASSTLFSPNGDGVLDTVTFTQKALTSGDQWIGTLKNARGEVVRRWTWLDSLPSLVWDGNDESIALVPDGAYTYELSSVDRAENSYSSGPIVVNVETEKKVVRLEADLRAFSPNGDGVKDTLTLLSTVQAQERVKQYQVQILALEGANAMRPVRTWQGAGAVPAKFVWGGETDAGVQAPDGRYAASMAVDYLNGDHEESQTSSILLDRKFPKIEVSADTTIISPNGDGRSDTVTIHQSSEPGDDWTGTIAGPDGKKVRIFNWKGTAKDFVWDGKDENGVIVKDGNYSYTVESTDSAGNSTKSSPLIVAVETEKKAVRFDADQLAFSPNGDGNRDQLKFGVTAQYPERIKHFELNIYAAEAGSFALPVRSWKGSSDIATSYVWDGTSDAGIPVPDGAYKAILTVLYKNDDLFTETIPRLIVDRVAPQATVSLDRSIFSPNGDGRADTVNITQVSVPGDSWKAQLLSSTNKVVKSWFWDNELTSISWDGRDAAGELVPDGMYTYTLSSVDSAGNSFAIVPLQIQVDAAKKDVRLSLDQTAFSPNGDGVKDTLTLLSTVQAQERVKQYQVQILALEGANAMRPVRTWQGAGAVPAKFVWGGETDAGVQAPDGRYAASMAVDYLNGDHEESQTSSILLDRKFPKIEVSADTTIISPNGDGRSDTVTIHQSSEPGDDWTGTIAGPDGKKVRIFNWKGTAKDFVWDGKDENGVIVKDGNYSYTVESTDSAGNSTKSSPLIVAVETEKKAVRFDADQLAFSPNGDGNRDQLKFGVTAQYPERIKHFELNIYAAEAGSFALPVRSWKGSSDIATSYVWDGTSDAGIPVPDGAYKAILTVLYKNDDLFTETIPRLIVDRVAPQATVSLDRSIFSPNGDGRADTVNITQVSVPGDSWKAQLLSSTNKVVKSWFWDNELTSISWDGRDAAGELVPDGMYTYTLSSVDSAGNSFAIVPLQIQVDAAKKDVRLSLDQTAFSPNGDGVKDTLYINLKVPKPDTLTSYELAIFAWTSGNLRGSPVAAWRGTTDIKDQYAWDGRTSGGIAVPDGTYAARLHLEYSNGDSIELVSSPVQLDTVAPKIDISADYLLFSPNGDGIKDTLVIHQKSQPGDDWTGRIKNSAGVTVRTWTWKGTVGDVSWDGKDSSGQIKEGQFSYEVSSVDAAGNKGFASLSGIRVDITKPRVYVTASDTGISPNGDGVRDDVSFSIVVEDREGVESWRFSLKDKKGTEQGYFTGVGSDVPARLVWDGHNMRGEVVPDEYVGVLEVHYLKGDIATASSKPIIVNINPPKVDISVSPAYFSPDGDGVDDELTFGINVDNAASLVDWKLDIMEEAVVESVSPEAPSSERLFMEWSGTGQPPAKIVWNGLSSKGELVQSATDYPFKFVGHDSLGNVTTVNGIVAVDVLVMRDGDRLKIKVPSIVFRANYADFVGLPSEITDRNEKVIARIAQILNKFPDYRIRIEGHGNNIGKMLGYSQAKIQAEETKELIPLSTARAEVVKNLLVQHGVDARRLSVQGLGSSQPVVSFTDVENRWKNRRVEFILIKNQ
ncbi:MAG TPA: FlgD immunoglobulin-like domain containing protein [Spirochaetales bacterium]|nr:FlgD immunoglobulin-like domain containing protein [Spirochaetales bacterium]